MLLDKSCRKTQRKPFSPKSTTTLVGARPKLSRVESSSGKFDRFISRDPTSSRMCPTLRVSPTILKIHFISCPLSVVQRQANNHIPGGVGRNREGWLGALGVALVGKYDRWVREC